MGLPIWARNSQLWYGVLFLLVGGYLLIAPIAKHAMKAMAGPKPPPTCYNLHGGKPLVSQHRRFVAGSSDFRRAVRRLRSMERSGRKVIKAMRYCTPESCPAGAAQMYERKLDTYIRRRASFMHRQFWYHGDVGLEWGHRKTGRRLHQDIVEGLRKRVGAGVFEFNSHRPIVEAANMLIHRDVREFGPCRTNI